MLLVAYLNSSDSMLLACRQQHREGAQTYALHHGNLGKSQKSSGFFFRRPIRLHGDSAVITIPKAKGGGRGRGEGERREEEVKSFFGEELVPD